MGGGKIDKMNIVLEPDSLKARIAKGGDFFSGIVYLNLIH